MSEQQHPDTPTEQAEGPLYEESGEESTELVTQGNQEAGPASVMMLPPDQMEGVLAEYDDRRKTFRRWLWSKMVAGVHYGIPPGCEPKTDDSGTPVMFIKQGGNWKPKQIPSDQWQYKATLYKAGAELICDLLMVRPRWERDDQTREMFGQSGDGAFYVCRLVSAAERNPFFSHWQLDQTIGEGRGAYMLSEKQSASPNQAIKLAEKRAKVDAVLHTFGLSDLFGQDEDQQTAPPAARPDQSENAASAPTREEREQQEQNESDELTRRAVNLFKRYRAQYANSGDDPESVKQAFALWAKAQARTNLDLSQQENWSTEICDKLEIVMDEVESQAK